MTALNAILAGGRQTASMLRAVAPLSAYKGADQSVTSSTALINDTALLLPLLANATYKVELELGYSGAATGTGDLKFKWAVPASATFAGGFLGIANPLGVTMAYATDATTQVSFSNGAANALWCMVVGTVTTAATAGNLQLTWAQNTSSGTATIVKTGSSLLAWQIA